MPEIIYENTVSGRFVRRLNRFTAEVLVDDRPVTVHVKNTGRLKELLVPLAAVTLQKAGDPKRRTAYDLISVYREGLGWVNIDSLIPNELMKRWLEGQPYDLVRPEYTYGTSRFDFYMEKGGERYLTEVKGCTLLSDDDPAAGLFPDAPTLRGVKHLNELAEAAGAGWHCAVAFVIQMNGVVRVDPNERTQPEFGAALARAVKAGVKVQYCSCHVEADRIRIMEVRTDEARL